MTIFNKVQNDCINDGMKRMKEKDYEKGVLGDDEKAKLYD